MTEQAGDTMEQAQQYMDSGRFAEAEVIYRSMLERDAGNAEAAYMLGIARRAQGDLGEALGLVARAAELEPENVNVRYTLATIHMDRRAVDEARRAYLQALQLDPFHIDSHNGLAYAELVAGNYTAAERAANLALTEDANNVQALVYLGTAKLEQGDASTAVAYLQEALKHAPAHVSAQLLLGRAFLANGNAAFAAQCFRNVLERDPESGAAWELLGVTQLGAGQAQEALQCFHRALGLGRETPALYAGLADCEEALGNPVQADQARLVQAKLLAKNGDAAEADRIVDGLLAKEQPLLAARFHRGAQLCRRGDERGIAMLQDIEREGGLPERDQRRVNQLLAAALDATGRYEEAAAYYGKLAGRTSRAAEVAHSGPAANRELLEAAHEVAAVQRADPELLPPDPVFVFAWPGSGWEWLAAVLGAHPGVMLVADQAETQQARRVLVATPAGVAALSGLTAEAAGQAAARYWAHLSAGGLEPGGRTTVDTMWLSADMLPTLARLFPAARVVAVWRDPREMALEWFRAGYADLGGMAETYTAQFDALKRYRALVNLEFILVDGGALPNDAESGVRALLDALGLPWDDAIAGPLGALAGIAARGRGSWTDYREALAGPLAVFDGGQDSRQVQ